MRESTFQGTPYTEMPEEQKKTKICPICQNQFKARSGSHKFCSLLCKTKNNQLNGSMMCTRQYERISGDWARYFNRLNRKTGKRPTLTTQNMLDQLEKQKGLCAICNNPETFVHSKTKEPARLAVDHCHTTGKTRKLLCKNCNTGLGSFKDNQDVLLKAMQYLKDDNV